MIILISKWVLYISPATTTWSADVCVNDLPWQCQIVNPTNWVRILFVLSRLIIHLQGKVKLCVLTIDRRLKL